MTRTGLSFILTAREGDTSPELLFKRPRSPMKGCQAGDTGLIQDAWQGECRRLELPLQGHGGPRLLAGTRGLRVRDCQAWQQPRPRGANRTSWAGEAVSVPLEALQLDETSVVPRSAHWDLGLGTETGLREHGRTCRAGTCVRAPLFRVHTHRRVAGRAVGDGGVCPGFGFASVDSLR